MPKPLDDKILEIALRETRPEDYEKFLPITKGPVVATLGIVLLGLATLVLLPFRWLILKIWNHRVKIST